MKTKHRVQGYIVLAMVLLLLALASFYFPTIKQFSSPEYLRDYLINLGGWGYVLFVLILIVSVPLPIPTVPLAIVGGYIYGLVLGTALTMVAVVIGGTIQFCLSRYLGESFLHKLVHEHHIHHFLHLFKKRGLSAAIISYAIPLFPSDSLNLILGLSGIPFLTYLFVLIVGSIPRYLIVNALGEDLHLGFSSRTIILLALAVIFVLITLFRERLKKVLFKELRTLEKEMGKEAHWVEREVNVMERQAGISRWRWRLRQLDGQFGQGSQLDKRKIKSGKTKSRRIKVRKIS